MEFLKTLQNLGWGTAISQRDYMRANARLFLGFMVVGALAVGLMMVLTSISIILNLSIPAGRVLMLGAIIPYGICAIWVLLHIVKITAARLQDFGLHPLWWLVFIYGVGVFGVLAAYALLPLRATLALSLTMSVSVLIIQYFLFFVQGNGEGGAPRANLFKNDTLGWPTRLVTALYVFISLAGLSRTLADYILNAINHT